VRRKDLSTGVHVDEGIYLLHGDESDPEARVVGGPYPNTTEGKQAATIRGEQLARRARTISLVLVQGLPG
jgi:hypothetical protein